MCKSAVHQLESPNPNTDRDVGYQKPMESVLKDSNDA